MIYKFMVLADLHWGAMDPILTYDNLKLVTDFIKEMRGEIDFVVIAGDYFDYRIQLNSKTSIYAVKWFEDLMDTCRKNGVRKVRMFKGTREHDNDQLEVFRPAYEDDTGYFRLYNETTSERLFHDLKVVFCPDENINLIDYNETKWNQFVPFCDLGFFHGNFDTILPRIEYERIQSGKLPIMVYEYERFAKLIRGPLISGHWHVATEDRSLYYVGSFDRWKFGEEEPKGFIYGCYNTETSEYFIHRIINENARIYRTLILTDDEYKGPADFAQAYDQIKNLLANDSMMQLRVVFIMSKNDPDLLEAFNVFQKHFSSSRQVKMEVKNLQKREEKKLKKKIAETTSKQISFIFDKDVRSVPKIIHQFLADWKGVEIPLEKIEKYVNKYLDFNR